MDPIQPEAQIAVNNPSVAPILPPTAMPIPAVAPITWHPKIIAWSAEIRIREGGHIGNRNVTNNNPGNIKGSKYTRQLGIVGHQATSVDNDNFLVFATEEDGMNALCQFLTECCQGEWLPYPKQENIVSFIQTYAQPPSNEYAIACAGAMDVPVTTAIASLLS